MFQTGKELNFQHSHNHPSFKHNYACLFYFYGKFFLEENYDYLFVDITADSGASWIPYGYLTGNIGGWHYISAEVPNEFKTSHFRLRFRLETDYMITYDGVYIDDVGIIACRQSNIYAYLAGTSMAAPHVTGACALIAAQYPDESASERKGRILNAVDPKPEFTGKVLTGGRLNLCNAFPATDSDGDGVADNLDNCPNHYNQDQHDSYPPPGNGMGDACEWEGNFNCSEDQDVDGTDAFTFKVDFGRSMIGHPCIAADTCNGDFTCDGDVDGSDAFQFKLDFGRSLIQNPCPACTPGVEWCQN